MTKLSPFLLSLYISVVSTLIDLVLGIISAKLVTGMKKGRFIMDSLFSLPLVLPPTVTGFLLLCLFGRHSIVGQLLETLGYRVVFTIHGAVAAATVVSFPLMYRMIRAAFEAVDTELIDMARLLGFDRLRLLIHVWIPLAWQGIAAGITLSFARALGEFGATIMVAGNIPNKTRTMSVAIYTAVQSGNRQDALVWVILITSVSLSMLLILNFLTAKRDRGDRS